MPILRIEHRNLGVPVDSRAFFRRPSIRMIPRLVPQMTVQFAFIQKKAVAQAAAVLSAAEPLYSERDSVVLPEFGLDLRHQGRLSFHLSESDSRLIPA